MSRRLMILLSVLALAVGVLTPVAAGATDGRSVPEGTVSSIADSKTAVYIVMMAEDPAITLKANGKVFNPNSGQVKKYRSDLTKQHNAAAADVGADMIYSYTVAFNGFAALMTGYDAAALLKRSDVLMVWQDEIRQLETDNSPTFLGLDADGGLWDTGHYGEDVIVGVIDTGIWPEHPSFSDQIDLSDAPGKSGKRNLAYGPAPSDWYGTCESGEQFSQDDCNNKLIGARYFKDGFTNNSIKITGDYLSARDADGHGSHTASTAAGNAEVPASILGSDLGMVSGIAPRARVAVYKACWADAGCAGSDLTMAIDQAVADGVDVINYSIGSSATTLASDDIAFLFAADAGVHIATSNGNDGPGASTVGSPAWVPWVTSVGANTQNRTFQGSASSGSDWEYFGASVTGGTEELTLVDAEDAGDELCNPGALDPDVVAGNIVLCKRGAIARVAKSLAVAQAGGVGTILYNANNADTQNADNHYTPAVHINNTDGLAIKAYIDSAGDGAVARINGGQFTEIPAPWMAAFSSRGPNGGAADIIKPDVTAPGVNILAANTPTPFLGAPDQLFQAIGGTSMSSPHVAGMFALLKDAHPDWSPSAAKSAIMTTADPAVKKEDGTTPADPFDMGSGHLTPNSATEPGLVYEAGLFDHLAFLCGNNPANIGQDTCDLVESLGYSLDPSDLNYPSIGIGSLVGSQTVTRTVTAVTGGTYNVDVVAPAGVDVVVNPATFTVATGESAPIEITFTATEHAVQDQWAFGSLTWNDGVHSVRSPIAVKPAMFVAPDEIADAGIEGSLEFGIEFGYSGDYSASAQGLVAADMQVGNVIDDPANDINTALGTCDWSSFPYQCVGITWHAFEVQPGSTYARFSLFDEYTDGTDDLDLYVWGPGGFFDGSGSGTSAEEVSVTNPAPGIYEIAVHGWQTDGSDSNYTLFNWGFGPDAGNMTVLGPASATFGPGTVTVDWSGLTADMKYLGAVSHSDGIDVIGTTIIGIDTN